MKLKTLIILLLVGLGVAYCWVHIYSYPVYGHCIDKQIISDRSTIKYLIVYKMESGEIKEELDTNPTWYYSTQKGGYRTFYEWGWR